MDRQTYKQTYSLECKLQAYGYIKIRQTYRQPYIHTDRIHTCIQTDRHTNRHTDGHKDRRKDRHTDRQVYKNNERRNFIFIV